MGRVAGVRSDLVDFALRRSRVTLEFGDDVDLDVAATDARDAVARIGNNLPDDAEQPAIVKADANAQPVIRVAVTSATRSPQELTELVQRAGRGPADLGRGVSRICRSTATAIRSFASTSTRWNWRAAG